MKVLVTGAAGFIGSHVLLDLLEKNFEVICVDDYSNCTPESYDNVRNYTGKTFEIIESHFADPIKIPPLLQQCNAVIHLAAKKSVDLSVLDPLGFLDTNVSETIKLLKMCESTNVRTFIFSSSSSVYGENTRCSEETPIAPECPYGLSKATIDQCMEHLCRHKKDWLCISLRYFNAVGAHESACIGENQSQITNLFPVIGSMLKGKREILDVFGTDYNTKDGTALRDFTHVQDIAEVHVKVLNAGLENGHHVFNIGKGAGYTVLEVVSAWEKEIGREIPKKMVGRRAGDVEERVSITSKAKQVLNWESRFDMSDMVHHAYEWIKKRP